jgi:hypothetical protein
MNPHKCPHCDLWVSGHCVERLGRIYHADCWIKVIEPELDRLRKIEAASRDVVAFEADAWVASELPHLADGFEAAWAALGEALEASE